MTDRPNALKRLDYYLYTRPPAVFYLLWGGTVLGLALCVIVVMLFLMPLSDVREWARRSRPGGMR